jgi:4-amino-4-deoxy-L-arabinose transferase-like glycosyltransferase
MHFPAFQDNTPALPRLALAALAAIYLLSGIVGHDPWKTEDAIHLGIAHGFTRGNWLFPFVAGEPWPHTAPLYHWVAALLGRLLDGLLPFHDAARLATPLFGALFLVALSGAAHAFHGRAAGQTAPLLAIGTLGLLVPLHDAQPAIAGLAFAALAWWGGGLLQKNEKDWRGAPLLGAGLGLAFLAHGLVGLLMAVAVLPAPTFRRRWRELLLALLIALPLVLVWPLLLSEAAPQFWAAWWRNELAEATIARASPTLAHLEQLAWGAWPVLPLAGWGVWLNRHRISSLGLPMLGALFTLVWFLSGSPRNLGVLPTLIPLTLLASSGADRLRRGAASAFDWFALVTFTLAAGLIWLGASAQALDWPPKIANNFDKLAPGHEAAYSFGALGWAAVLSLGWLLVWRLPRAGWRASLRWATGLTLMWALVTTLWIDWIDHGKSYRSTAVALRAALPRDAGCIERSGIGTAQRASLDYFAAIRTQPPARAKTCSWRLSADAAGRVAPPGWTIVWQGGRPSDRKERWYLERRED